MRCVQYIGRHKRWKKQAPLRFSEEDAQYLIETGDWIYAREEAPARSRALPAAENIADLFIYMDRREDAAADQRPLETANGRT